MIHIFSEFSVIYFLKILVGTKEEGFPQINSKSFLPNGHRRRYPLSIYSTNTPCYIFIGHTKVSLTDQNIDDDLSVARPETAVAAIGCDSLYQRIFTEIKPMANF